jgi:hypothetical protein
MPTGSPADVRVVTTVIPVTNCDSARRNDSDEWVLACMTVRILRGHARNFIASRKQSELHCSGQHHPARSRCGFTALIDD